MAPRSIGVMGYLVPIEDALVDAGQLARWLGMKRRSVAAAERAGRLPPARRTPGGHRRWGAAELVTHLRARGATVPPELLALLPDDGVADSVIRSVLDEPIGEHAGRSTLWWALRIKRRELDLSADKLEGPRAKSAVRPKRR